MSCRVGGCCRRVVKSVITRTEVKRCLNSVHKAKRWTAEQPDEQEAQLLGKTKGKAGAKQRTASNKIPPRSRHDRRRKTCSHGSTVKRENCSMHRHGVLIWGDLQTGNGGWAAYNGERSGFLPAASSQCMCIIERLCEMIYFDCCHRELPLRSFSLACVVAFLCSRSGVSVGSDALCGCTEQR